MILYQLKTACALRALAEEVRFYIVAETALHEFCVQPQQCDAAMPHSDCGADFKCVCLDDYDEIQAICHKSG